MMFLSSYYSSSHAIMIEVALKPKTLTDLIRDAGYTRKQLATMVGVNPSAIGHWCNPNPERRKMPSLDKAIALAVALDVDIKTLARSLDIPLWDKLP
jgi:transcriptional regulator with XRE-family HTH domain